MAFASPRGRSPGASRHSAQLMEDDDGYEAILRRPVDKHCSTCNVLRGAFEDIISDLKLELAIVGMQVRLY